MSSASAWTRSGEGSTELDRGKRSDAMFNESDVVYTSEDIRFTVKNNVLYAIALDWPGESCLIRSFNDHYRKNPLYRVAGSVTAVSCLISEGSIWSSTCASRMKQGEIRINIISCIFFMADAV